MCQVVRDMHGLQLQAIDFLHRHLVDEDRLMDPQLSPPKVNNQILVLANIVRKIVIPRAFV